MPYQAQEDNSLLLTNPVSHTAFYRKAKCDYWDRIFDYLSTSVRKVPSNPLGTLSITPNPVRDYAQLHIDLPAGIQEHGAIVRVLDARGKVALFQVLELKPGNTTYPLQVSTLAPGIYPAWVSNRQIRLHTALAVRD